MSAEEKYPDYPVWRRLLSTPEGRILLLGVALALAGLVMIVSVSYWSMPTSRMIGAMSFANIIFGRAVSMSVGYSNGYGHALVMPVNIWMETVLVLLFYPVFVLSMRKLVKFPRLGGLINTIRKAAERHHDKVRRYGIFGLLVFVGIPFWMTGPVVGCAIGYLIGFPSWLTLTVVLIGTYIAIAGWAMLLFDLHTHAAGLSAWAPILIIGMAIVLSLAGYFLNRRG
jgi:uncharacterized membrane protein